MAAKTFTDFALRLHDDDATKTWGGHVSSDTGTPVQDLQTALAAVGVFDLTQDGAFGKNTQDAVKRFQWNLRNTKFRIVGGALQARTPSAGVSPTGVADSATTSELKAWTLAGATATGTLARVDLAAFPRLSDNFKTIDNPTVHNGDLVVDDAFLGSLQKLNDAAASANVILPVNQAFRVAGVPVGGAVVRPATKSQHLIGHAIDCNIQDGAILVSSNTFAGHHETLAAKAFVRAAKAAGLRWGGDFTPVDYVHFDDFVPPDGDEFAMRYFFNQRTISKRQPVPPP
jgi:hypothetical protein